MEARRGVDVPGAERLTRNAAMFSLKPREREREVAEFKTKLPWETFVGAASRRLYLAIRMPEHYMKLGYQRLLSEDLSRQKSVT